MLISCGRCKMWRACGGASGSAVRREESIPTMSVKLLCHEQQKHCRISPCPEPLLWLSLMHLKAESMNILTTMSSNVSLHRCPLQHRFNPSASFASESCLHARSHRSCELATWCPRPFSLMSSCLSCAFLSFGDSIFWRGFHTLVREHTDEPTFSGHPDATKIAQETLPLSRTLPLRVPSTHANCAEDDFSGGPGKW